MDENLKDLIRDYLESHGYDVSMLDDLVEEYEEMQEWNEDIMTTGNSYDEVADWIRHKVLK